MARAANRLEVLGREQEREDIDVFARYNAANRAGFAFWRRNDGTWHVVASSTLTARARQWGQRRDA